MRKDEAIAALKAQSVAVKALGTTALFLFGSTARESATSGSDLDVFIEYDHSKHFSLIELAEIKLLLEQRLGTSVDLTTRDSLDPLPRERIEVSAEQVF